LLYLLDKDVRTVRWNGEPLHEATSAIVKETMNGDFTLTVKYPISDSEIYQLIQEDMLIKAPTPVLGAQLFRIKTPVEHNDYLEITAYHISDDIMQRSITPLSVSSQSCDMALSRMVQNTKTALGDFSFNSDIQERRTFNTTETETLYSVLLDGKHSIVGTWEGELVRDNFAMTVKKNRGENRGVVITTHKNLKDYQRTRNSQNVVTRIHAKSTFKPEGAETETTLKVTVDSPLINSYPYINEKEYENNNAKTVEELKKWAQAKFTNQGIDKVSDAIKIEAYELDGQVVHMGDTVNIKSRKHNVDAFKKAIAYEFDALKEEYISLTFDDKAGTGGSRSSGGLSNAADAIIGVTESAQEIALEKALQNADLAFDHQAGLLRQEILDGVELAKAKAEENKRALSDEIDRRFHEFSPEGFDEAKKKAEEALKQAKAGFNLADEAKYIAEQNSIIFASIANRVNQQDDKLKNAITDFKNEYGSKMLEVTQTTDGIKTKIGEITSFIDKDGQRQEELKRYAREETAKQTSAIRETLSRDYVAKSTFTETVESTNQRFEALTRDNEAKLAEYKQGIDGRFTSLLQSVAGKANQVDFQRVRETAQLYERIFGNTQNGVADNISRMVLTNQVFQTEVKKYVEDNSNLVFDPTNFSKWTKKQADANVIKVQAGTKLLRITNAGNTNVVYHGFALPLTTSNFTEGEKLSYRMEAWVDVLPDAPLGIELWAKDGGLASDSVTFTKTGTQIITGTITVRKSSTEGREFPLEIWLMKNGTVAIGKVSLIRGETPPSEFKDDTSAQDVVTQSKVTQLFDSYAIQTLTNAGAIASQINTNANNILIEANKIRLKGKTLADEITAIDGYFKRLFVGDAQIGTLNTDIIRSNSIAADKLIFDTALAKKLVASDVFTDTLAAKTAFINKLRSVVVSATLLEGYKGKIGGFQIGTHDKDATTFWLTGSNSFRVGMSDGGWKVNQTCLWVNWGNDWGKPGDNAWYVTNSGEMNCRGAANFYKKVDFSAISSVNFYGRNTFYSDIHMTNKEILGDGGNPKGGKNAVVWWNQVGSGSVKYWSDKASDRRLKENIAPTTINALDAINKLDMVEFDFIKDKKHEEVGLIAQEVEKVIPQAISRNPENEDDFLHIDYTAFVPYLIKAIQELNQKVERLETTT
jgi:phage minor structural protein